MASRVFDFDRAILRAPAETVSLGLRAGAHPRPTGRAIASEHKAYADALVAAGLGVEILPALDRFPDSIFVEDPALVFTGVAILLRPGAPSRAGEVAALDLALRGKFDLVRSLPAVGYVDGGDVLGTPEKVVIGVSKRTDEDGARALQRCLNDIGRASELVQTPDNVLHLKTACTLLDEETILVTRDAAQSLSQSNGLNGFKYLIVPDDESAAANALRANDVVLASASHPKTLDLLDRNGFSVVPLVTDEIGKIDAGLTCMSLRWKMPV